MSKLDGRFYKKLVDTIDQLLEAYLELGLADGLSGGYLTVRDIHDGSIIFIAKVGQVPADKLTKYFTYSLEKGDRLSRNINQGYLTSYQGREPKRLKFGGAIIVDEFSFSFSGLPELGDEALMLCLAKEMKLIYLIGFDQMKYGKFGDDVDKQILEGYLAGRKNEHYEKLNKATSKEE